MTDKLIMTTADRDYFLKCIKTLCIGSHSDATRAAQTLQGLLQSLPMVDSEPVAWRRFDDVDIAWHVELTTNDDYDGWEPLYTSPQALAPITADDVTDEMLHSWSEIFVGGNPSPESKKIMAAAYNAVIKHRREA